MRTPGRGVYGEDGLYGLIFKDYKEMNTRLEGVFDSNKKDDRI